LAVKSKEGTDAGSDRKRLTATVVAFGVSLGTTAVAFPLLALEAGFSAGVVGLLAALSAAVQMVAKMSLPSMLAKVTDRSLMTFSLTVMVASASTLLFTTAAFGFITAQVLQGIARGVFWTASQTHAVRGPGHPTKQLGFVQTMGQIGNLLGPALAGTLAAISLSASLWAGVIIAGLGVIVAGTLHSLAPYQREPAATRTPIWKRKGVGPGAWAGAAAGAWRGILDSFVPVILDRAGLTARLIGWLMSTADGSSLAATAAVARWGGSNVGRFIPLSAAALGAGVILLPLVDATVAIIVVLIVAGVGGGLAGILSTASVNESVEPSEQGAAIALAGVYRAGARSFAPAFISGMLLFFAMPVALTLAGLGVVAPAAWIRGGRASPTREQSRSEDDAR
jgi:MFS family permease